MNTNITWKLIGAFIVLFLNASLKTYSQDIEKKISYQTNLQSINKIIREIEPLTSFHFSYNPKAIDAERKISVDINKRSVRECFDEIFTKNGISWQLIGKQVVLKPDLKSRKKTVSLNGYIRDSKTGEVLIGASIWFPDAQLGTVSNAYGFYSVTLPVGEYRTSCSFVGYQSQSALLPIMDDMRLDFYLEERITYMETVEIVDDNIIGVANVSFLGAMRLGSKTLSEIPGFAGDSDVLKALDAIPGIANYGDGSTLFYVRGGAADQNMLLIDDAPIYNPSHLFGFFTAFAPDAIKDVEAYKGDFPARFGGRLSSLIDIRTKDGNLKRHGFSGNIGPFASGISIEGPLSKDVSSFYLAARRSNLNWLKPNQSLTNSFNLYFFDVNAKLNYQFNSNNRFYLTFFHGKDDFSRISQSALKTFGISWDNILGTLRWNHIYNERLFSNITAYFSRYNYFLYTDRELNDFWTSSIENTALKADFTYYHSPSNTLRFGMDIAQHYINPGNVYFSDPLVQKFVPKIPEYHSRSAAFYISAEQNIIKSLRFRYGLRFAHWQNIGPTTQYYYDVNYKPIGEEIINKGQVYYRNSQLEPRLSLSFYPYSNAEFKLSYNRTAQFLQVLSNSESPFTSLEVYAPSGPNIAPQTADQFAAGFVRQSQNRKWMMSIEGFYKSFYNQIDYREHANMLYNPYLEGELRFGTAKAYGLEMIVRKNTGKLTGWVAYTWSRAIKTIEGVNYNNDFPAFYDRPHDFNVSLSYSPLYRIKVSAAWYFLSGGAITTPNGFFNYGGYIVPLYGEKNNDRLPDYHRLDVSVEYRLNKPQARFQHSLVLTLYNAYARKNPFSINFNKVLGDDGNIVNPTDLYGGYEAVSTQLAVAGFIPSFNYTFRF